MPSPLEEMWKSTRKDLMLRSLSLSRSEPSERAETHKYSLRAPKDVDYHPPPQLRRPRIESKANQAQSDVLESPRRVAPQRVVPQVPPSNEGSNMVLRSVPTEQMVAYGTARTVDTIPTTISSGTKGRHRNFLVTPKVQVRCHTRK